MFFVSLCFSTLEDNFDLPELRYGIPNVNPHFHSPAYSKFTSGQIM